jgi:ADP-dependent NAD(P)H-hydrate dehydratase / NAD(P)H-hydrate epimerase
MHSHKSRFNDAEEYPMIPILTLEEMQAVERKSAEHGLSEYDMIMSAGEAVYQSVKSMLEEEYEQGYDDDFAEEAPENFADLDENESTDPGQTPKMRKQDPYTVAFVCGKGHNGADALSAALLCAQASYAVIIYQLHSENPYSSETLKLHQQLRDVGLEVHIVMSPVDLPVFQDVDLIVDGLLGTGARGIPTGLVQSCIYGMNKSGIPVLSVDVPSGVQCDLSEVPGSAVQATATICLGAIKVSAAFYPSCTFYGRIGYSPICFDERSLVSQPSQIALYTPEDAIDDLPARDFRSNKYTSGKVLVITGSRGMHGAAALASNAALRAGAGLVRCAVPAGIYSDLTPHLLEVIGVPIGENTDYRFTPGHLEEIKAWLDWADTILVGPGMGKHPQTEAFLEKLMPLLKGRKVVVDGDALNWFALEHGERRKGPGLEETVLTPHAGEFKRIGGEWDYDLPLQHIENLRNWVKAGNLPIVLKGATTLFAEPNGKLLVVPAGNPGMATAGSGDVLAGMLAAFLAVRPMTQAAPLAVLAHGKAGDAARKDRGTLGMTASDLILYLPSALKEIEDQIEDAALDAETEK